jgi:hypothetical protein
VKAILALVALAAVGCAPPTQQPTGAPVAPTAQTASSTASPLAPTLPPPSASPVPTPVALSQDEIRKAAGAAYLAAVKPYNKTLDALNKAYRNKTDLPALRRFCSKLAANEHKWLSALHAIAMPDDTVSDTKSLIRSDASAEADLRSCAKAADRSHEAANIVRLDLNLSSVPG